MSKITDKYGELPKAAKPDDIELTPEELNKELAKFTAQQDKALNQLNGTEQSLCAQLMLVNTVLITASIVVLGSITQSASFSTWDKLLVAIAFTLLAASTLSGIRYYFEIMSLHKKWVDVKHSITYFIASRHYTHYKQMSEDIVERQGKVKGDTGKKYLYIQISGMVAAFVIYVVLIMSVLFFGITAHAHHQPRLFNIGYNRAFAQ